MPGTQDPDGGRASAPKSYIFVGQQPLSYSSVGQRWDACLVSVRAAWYTVPMSDTSRTLALIKPDAVGRKLSGQIIDHILAAGFEIVALKSVAISTSQAEAFYAVHRERPFYRDLVSFMTSGPAIALVLEHDAAVAAWRQTMGATNPAEAEAGTIRQRFGESIERNCSHGSDSDANAVTEIGFFFSGEELLR